MNAVERIYHWGLQMDRALTKAVRLPAPVISVGNLALGGRAKTPLVIEIVKLLQEKSFQPIVLTRGYGRARRAPHCVTVDLQTPVANCGDEALEIFLRTGAVVLVGANRCANAQAFVARTQPAAPAFVLDDGFQHWALMRDIDVVVVADGDFTDYLMPMGRLREPPRALERADLVLRLGQDCHKRVILPAAAGATVKNSHAVTTRATIQTDYFAELSRVLGFSVAHTELRDHADAAALGAAVERLNPAVEFLFVGYKEAVKLIPASELVLEKNEYQLAIGPRRFTVIVASLALEWPRERFLDIFRKKVTDA